MNYLDITNESKAPFSFAEKEKSDSDVRRAKRILQKVYKHVADFMSVDTLPSTVTFLNKHNRNCRIIVYDFEKLLSQKNVFVVIFYADKRDKLSKEFTKDFFKTDWEIAMSMMGDVNILCYVSEELADGNWFNIVLFTKEAGKTNVVTKEKHAYAAYTLAPKRFSWVRLHNAMLPEGIAGYKQVIFTKTKYYNFDTMWFATRNYENYCY